MKRVCALALCLALLTPAALAAPSDDWPAWAEDALAWGRERSVSQEFLNAPEETVTAVNTGWLGEARPAVMGRIVCLEACLEAIRSPRPRTVRLQVEDPLLPENSGRFRWRLTPSGSRLEPAAQETPELSLGIEALGEWLLGGAAPDEYREIQTLSGGYFPEIV